MKQWQKTEPQQNNPKKMQHKIQTGPTEETQRANVAITKFTWKVYQNFIIGILEIVEWKYQWLIKQYPV